MKKTNHLLASLFSFFIAFFMFLGLFVTITKLTLMNENYLFKTLEKVDYYQAIANELNEDFMQSAGAAGFEPDIYKNFVSSKEVKKMSQDYIQNFYTHKQASIHTDAFEKRLYEYLHDYAKKQNLQLTQQDEERLNQYIQINVKGYQQYLSFPFMQYLIMAFDMLDQVIPFILIACLIIVLFAIVFLYLLKLKGKWKAIYISSICIGSAFMITGIPFFILLGQYIEHIHLSPEAYYLFIVQYLKGYLNSLLLCGGLLFIIGILVVLFQKKGRITN